MKHKKYFKFKWLVVSILFNIVRKDRRADIIRMSSKIDKSTI